MLGNKASTLRLQDIDDLAALATDDRVQQHHRDRDDKSKNCRYECLRDTAGHHLRIACTVKHPVYQYLAQAYGLDIISEHWEPGEMPDDKQWDDFKHNLDHNTSNFMLWEGEPGQDIKDSLKSLGITTVLFGPCSNKPKASNFLEIMRENVKNMTPAPKLS